MTRAIPPTSRPPGLSVRAKLTLSYAVFVVVVGVVFFIVGFLLLRFVPSGNLLSLEGEFAPSRSDLLATFVRYAVLALLLLAALGLGGGWILAGRMLKPLTRITAATRSARDGSLDHRIRMPGGRNELSELADTFDEMLDRLRDAFDVQERFAANASHELRTPLAVMSTMLDVAARNPREQDYPRLVERLRATNDRAVELTESLLRLADANAVNARAEPVAFSRLVAGAIADSAEEIDRRGVTVTSQLDAEAMVVGDAGLLGQLVTNLVQNAIRHSGSSGSASISTRSDPTRDTMLLRLVTTGIVFDADTAARLAEPFLRGSGRIAHAEKGHGLGLALVQSIVALHNGSLAIVPRSGGGLIVDVELPIAGA